jgi:hypothetical protein
MARRGSVVGRRAWKPSRRACYKLCADKRLGVYTTHRMAGTLREARRLARRMSPDVVVLLVKKRSSTDVTNKILGRPGPCFRLDKPDQMRLATGGSEIPN